MTVPEDATGRPARVASARRTTTFSKCRRLSGATSVKR
jgi:hypothetical protein